MTFTYCRQGRVSPLPRRLSTTLYSGLLLFGTLSPPALAADAPTGDGLSYRSVFEGYQAHTRERSPDWRQANERVRQIGGWRTYARESQESGKSDAPAAPAAAPAAAPVPAPPATPSGAPPAKAPPAHQHGEAHGSKK